jgi:hypothetical protein
MIVQCHPPEVEFAKQRCLPFDAGTDRFDARLAELGADP